MCGKLTLVSSVHFKSLCFFVIVGIQSLQAQNIPVNHYTGQPVINIPLFTITDRSLSETVSLSYDASGVKIDQPASWVGQNWTLVAGGEVRRNLRGLPDDFTAASGDNRKGWLFDSNTSANTNAVHVTGYLSYPADGAGLNCTNENTVYNFVNAFGHVVDTEPDVFTFSTSDFSGSFTFDNTGLITAVKCVPFQELTIIPYRPTSTSPIASFDIITAFGVKYTFSEVESVTRQAQGTEPFYVQREYQLYKTAMLYNTAWKLKTISAPTGEEIQFSYTPLAKTKPHNVDFGVANTGGSTDTKTQYSISDSYTYKILSFISSAHQSLTFSTGLSNYTDNGLLLTTMLMNEITPFTSLFVKSVTLQQGDVGSSLDPQWYKKRVYLSQVKINDGCEERTYKLDYNTLSGTDIALPNSDSDDKDIWGYYRSGTGGVFPQLYVYPSSTGIQRISLYQRTGVAGEIIVSGASRLPSGTPTAGVLSKITYPSGGTTEFTYENNSFLNPITNAQSTGGGLRIYSIKHHDGVTFQNDIVKTYEYSGGKVLFMPSFWSLTGAYKDPVSGTVTTVSGLSALTASEQWRRLLLRMEDNQNEDVDAGTPVVYQTVTEKTGTAQGKTVFEFDIPFTYGAAASGDWNPTYTHIARSNACPSTGFNAPDFYNHLNPPQTPYDFARGLLTKVSHYKEGSTDPVKETLYTYADKTISPATVKGLRYELIPYNVSGGVTLYYYMYGVYTRSTQKLKVLTQVEDRVKDMTASKVVRTYTTYTYATNHTFAKSITTTNSDSTKLISRFAYARDYNSPSLATAVKQVNMIDTLNLTYRYGTVIESVTSAYAFGSIELTNSGTLYEFTNAGTASNVIPLATRTLALAPGDGIAGLSLSSFSGSGAARTFTKNAGYSQVSSTLNVKKKTAPSAKVDVIRREGMQRQFESVHPDNLTGAPVLVASNVEPHEIVYTSFDHDTDFDFDLIGFTVGDKGAVGKTGAQGLAGFYTGGAKYLKKQFRKKPSTKYVFSTWYKAPVTTGTHSVKLVIKNTSNAILQQHTIPFTVTSTTDWYYGELVADLGALANTDIVAEVSFGGTYTSAQTSVLDEVSLYPVGTDLVRNTYHTAYGLTSSTAPDGRIAYQEYDPAGKLKYVRDHEGNIIEKSYYSRWSSASVPVPIGFTWPATVYDNTATLFTANMGCIDVNTIQWKTEPVSSPGSGVWTNGSDEQNLVFTLYNQNYTVFLKVSHPSYGSYEVSQTVYVTAKPLTVALCVEGAISRDLCGVSGNSYATCSGQTYSSADATTFTATPSGCPGGSTYTYQWQIDYGSGFINAGTTNTVVFNNTAMYTVRCLVSSNCGRTGATVDQTVTVYESTPGCPSGEN